MSEQVLKQMPIADLIRLSTEADQDVAKAQQRRIDIQNEIITRSREQHDREQKQTQEQTQKMAAGQAFQPDAAAVQQEPRWTDIHPAPEKAHKARTNERKQEHGFGAELS